MSWEGVEEIFVFGVGAPGVLNAAVVEYDVKYYLEPVGVCFPDECLIVFDGAVAWIDVVVVSNVVSVV